MEGQFWMVLILVCMVELSCLATKPNILFILTDDQDVFLNGTVGLNPDSQKPLSSRFLCNTYK